MMAKILISLQVDEGIEFNEVITGDGRRRLIEGFLTGGQVPDVKVAAKLSRAISGCAVIGDRGYDNNEFWRELEGNNNTAVIPSQKNRKEAIVYDKEKYKKRGVIERLLWEAEREPQVGGTL